MATGATLSGFVDLASFFFAGSALSVGLYISKRVKAALGKGMLARVVDAHLMAAGGLTLRSAAALLATLGWINPSLAKVVGDLALVVMGLGLFLSYLAIEKYFKKVEARRQPKAAHED